MESQTDIVQTKCQLDINPTTLDLKPEIIKLSREQLLFLNN